MNYIAIVFFTLLAGGGMAATNCGSILSKYSLTVHIRFCTWSLIGANAKPSRLNLAWIDSAPCSPRRPSQHGEYLPTAQYGPPIGAF